MTKNYVECAEFILPGHPDRLCDASVDAVVDAMARMDPEGQCGLEAACIFDQIYLSGRIAGSPEALDTLDIGALVRRSWRKAGYGPDASGHLWGPDPESLKITTSLCFGPFEPGERENRHLSDDQAICVGYASADAETENMPPAHWLSRKIARRIFDLRPLEGVGQLGPDGKVLVQVERRGSRWKPLMVSLSLNHHDDSDWLFLRQIAERAVEESCGQHPTPPILLNGAGSFVAGGPNGDNGLSGKKLVTDAYGPTIPKYCHWACNVARAAQTTGVSMTTMATRTEILQVFFKIRDRDFLFLISFIIPPSTTPKGQTPLI